MENHKPNFPVRIQEDNPINENTFYKKSVVECTCQPEEPIKEIEHIFFADKRHEKECKVCGISSFSHQHFKGDLPKDYVELPDNILHASNAPSHKPQEEKEIWFNPENCCDKCFVIDGSGKKMHNLACKCHKEHGTSPKPDEWEKTIEPIVNRIKRDESDIVDFREIKDFIKANFIPKEEVESKERKEALEKINSDVILTTIKSTRQRIIGEIEEKLPKERKPEVRQNQEGHFYEMGYKDGFSQSLAEVKDILKTLK